MNTQGLTKLFLTRSEVIFELVAKENITINRKNLPLGGSLTTTIKNCVFYDLSLDIPIVSITFENCQFKTLEIFINYPTDRIVLSNCKIETLLIKGDGNVRLTSLSICGELKYFNIYGHISKVRLHDLKKCVQVEQDVKVSDSVITGAGIDSLELNSISDLVIIAKGRINKIFNERFYNIGLTLNRIIDLAEFTTTNCEVSLFRFVESGLNKVNFTDGTDNSILIENVTSGRFALNGGSYKSVLLSGSGSFTLKAKGSESTNLTIDKFVMSYFDFEEKGYIDFERIESIRELRFANVQNEGSIYINGCEIKDRLTIVKSKLNRCTYNNISLDEKCEVDILDVDISDTNFNNFRWNKNYLLSDKFTDDKYVTYSSFLLALRESYRQLKSNYLKNGNKIEALEFQRNELSAHYRILTLRLSKEPTWKNLGNFLIVASNKWFSDFGQNIWKPVVFLMAFHLLWFNILLIDKFGIYPIIFGWDDNITVASFNSFFITLLPTHGLELTINDATKSIGGWIDFFMRIFSSYFIFYFVYSSRKYHH